MARPSFALSLLPFRCHRVLVFKLTVIHSSIITVVILFRMISITDRHLTTVLLNFVSSRFVSAPKIPQSLIHYLAYPFMEATKLPGVRAALATRHHDHLLLPLQQTNTQQ
jgi:hypothetical protein